MKKLLCQCLYWQPAHRLPDMTWPFLWNNRFNILLKYFCACFDLVVSVRSCSNECSSQQNSGQGNKLYSLFLIVAIWCYLCRKFSLIRLWKLYLIKCRRILKLPKSMYLIFNTPCHTVTYNPLTPKSDEHVTSPYNIHTLSCKWVMRIFKLIV